jgi:hypothetical protein
MQPTLAGTPDPRHAPGRAGFVAIDAEWRGIAPCLIPRTAQASARRGGLPQQAPDSAHRP